MKNTVVFLVIQSTEELNVIRRLIENEHGKDTNIKLVTATDSSIVFAPNGIPTGIINLVNWCNEKSNGKTTYVYFYGKLTLRTLKTAWRAGTPFRRFVEGNNGLIIRHFGKVSNRALIPA